MTSINGIRHSLQDRQLKTPKNKRQEELRSVLIEMDETCQVTGRTPAYSDAAHLVKTSNPDIVSHFPVIYCARLINYVGDQATVHILASRSALYPSNASVIANFAGSYDPRLALLLDSGLHRQLDDNKCYFRASDTVSSSMGW